MKILTNTPRLRKYRKNILELLLANHCRDCTTCTKSGRCRLQELAHRFGVSEVRFPTDYNQSPKDTSSYSICSNGAPVMMNPSYLLCIMSSKS